MSSNKKRKVLEPTIINPGHIPLPVECRHTVRNHINSIYVASIVRVYDQKYKPEGRLVTVHWATDDGLYVTCHDKKICEFLHLKYKSWVVDHRMVKPGSFLVFRRYGTNDIKDDTRNKTVNEMKQLNSKILQNDTLMDFPTEKDRQTYECELFRLTCNCGFSKRVKKMECSKSNPHNPGKWYYACKDRYNNKNTSCNFFVWSIELEHMSYMKCHCGKLCKKTNFEQNNTMSKKVYVCVNRNNKIKPGCNFILEE